LHSPAPSSAQFVAALPRPAEHRVRDLQISRVLRQFGSVRAVGVLATRVFFGEAVNELSETVDTGAELLFRHAFLWGEGWDKESLSAWTPRTTEQ
jgi:hypothetical protein